MPFDAATAEKELTELKTGLKKVTDETKRFAEQAMAEIKNKGGVAEETKASADKALTGLNDLTARVVDVEQKLARRPGAGAEDGEEHKTIGQRVVESEEFKALSGAPGQKGRAFVEVKAITTAAASAGALVANDRRPGVVENVPERRMVVRDLLTPGRTTSGTVEYVKELLFTNNAAMVGEGAAKPESALTFEPKTSTARVIAHWIQASKQVLSDAPQLQSIIDGRLRYGLALKEEDQLLYGDGTGQNLLGLVPQASAYSAPFAVAGGTNIDTLRLAMLQATLAEYPASGMVLHPIDWARIELTKTSEGAYIFANPQRLSGPVLWGLPVVPTTAMTVDKFLVGAFKLGAQIFDRWDASVLVSTEDRDNFIKNMVTVLAEERLALAVYRPQAFIYGDLGNVA